MDVFIYVHKYIHVCVCVGVAVFLYVYKGTAVICTVAVQDEFHFTLFTNDFLFVCLSLSLSRPACLSLSPPLPPLSLSPSLEQYDAFVKFSHDQVERRFAESAFSCKHRMFLIIIIIIIACCFIQMCHESFSLFFWKPTSQRLLY